MNALARIPWALAAVACLAAPVAVAGDAGRAAEGRAIAAGFGADLRAALQAAMGAGGPLAAIAVCNEEAPRIASGAAPQAGVVVGRTSLKTRNPGNRPDDHERAVLEEFAELLAGRADGLPPERLDTLENGSVRYMRAIIIEPPCLACHGESLAPAVAEAIDALYPEDEARGYRAGDLRGAFTITWPPE